MSHFLIVGKGSIEKRLGATVVELFGIHLQASSTDIRSENCDARRQIDDADWMFNMYNVSK